MVVNQSVVHFRILGATAMYLTKQQTHFHLALRKENDDLLEIEKLTKRRFEKCVGFFRFGCRGFGIIKFYFYIQFVNSKLAIYLFRSSVNAHQGFGSFPSIKLVIEINTSKTQRSCFIPVFWQSASYKSYGFFPFNSEGLLIPSNNKSFSIALPILGKSVSLTVLFLLTLFGFMASQV